MNVKLKKTLIDLLGYAVIIGFVLGIIAIIAMFAGVVMKFFGFSYNSVGSIILFFGIVAGVGFPLEIMCNSFPSALVSMNVISRKNGRILFVGIDSLCTFVVMYCVDYFMSSVSASVIAMIVASLLLAILSIDKEKL